MRLHALSRAKGRCDRHGNFMRFTSMNGRVTEEGLHSFSQVHFNIYRFFIGEILV